MKKMLLIISLFVFTSNADAIYNSNIRGVLTGVFTYSDGDYI